MLCKPKCLADIRLLPSRRQGVLRFFRAHEKGTSLSTCTKDVMEEFFLENFQQEDIRLEVA